MPLLVRINQTRNELVTYYMKHNFHGFENVIVIRDRVIWEWSKITSVPCLQSHLKLPMVLTQVPWLPHTPDIMVHSSISNWAPVIGSTMVPGAPDPQTVLYSGVPGLCMFGISKIIKTFVLYEYIIHT